MSHPNNFMVRNVFIFLATFAVGALIAFTGRAMRHKPEEAPSAHASPLRAPMVSNPLRSADAGATTASAHATPGHAAVAAPTDTVPPATVNTVCAICGMEVDPKVPALEYQGKMIGFGCKLCPPKFKADPDKYGPLYLRNEVVKR